MDYFDLHCDTPYACYDAGLSFLSNKLAVSAAKEKLFNRWSQVFAVWINDNIPNPFDLYQRILSNFSAEIANTDDHVKPYFSVEGGAVLEDKIERLDVLKNDGISALTLTWNGENRIAGGAYSVGTMTDFGREVLRRMERLQIACDLSHLNDRSFDEVLELSWKPFVSHACCRALVNHPRNVTDDRLLRLVERGGIFGLCFYPEFCGSPVFEALYQQICHLLDLGLEDAISIGSDFDGAVMSPELDSISKIEQFSQFLSEKGLPDSILEKIFYQNAEKFFVCL